MEKNNIGSNGAKMVTHPHNVITKGTKIKFSCKNLFPLPSLGFTRAKQLTSKKNYRKNNACFKVGSHHTRHIKYIHSSQVYKIK